jgi:TIR domain
MSAGPVAPPKGKGTAQKVFICYRREETAAHAGRLYDAMVNRFGEANVFMDVDMAPGVDFVERITEVVSGCLALIVVMGPGWATASDEQGGRRIEDEADFVRLEVETGLSHADVTPIPVLVGGARMPRPEDLPPALRPITRRNAVEMSEARWGYDVARLFGALEELLPNAAGTQAKDSLDPRPPPPVPGWGIVPEGMAVAALATAAARAVAWKIPLHADAQHPASTSEVVHQVVATVLRQGGTGAVTGAALAIWLGYRVSRSGGLLWLRGLLVGALAGILSGAILGLIVFLPEKNIPPDERGPVGLLSVPVAGAVLGALIGSLWRPARVGAACLAGALGGLLFQLAWLGIGADNTKVGWVDVAFGLAAASIAGLALATMLVLDRRRAAAGAGRAAVGT